jgi:hypothetical protein
MTLAQWLRVTITLEERERQRKAWDEYLRRK